MKLKKKPVAVAILLAAALGVATFTVALPEPTSQVGETTRSEDRISLNVGSLNISDCVAFPELTPLNGDTGTACHIWSVHNEEAIRFVSLVGSNVTSVEMMIADLDDPEIFYQIIVDMRESKVDYYKYVGGMWVTDPVVKRTSLTRITWNEVSTIDLAILPGRVDITIPWDAIKGVNSKDRIGFQFIRNEGDTRYVDSLPNKTSVLDRGNWNELILK